MQQVFIVEVDMTLPRLREGDMYMHESFEKYMLSQEDFRQNKCLSI